MEGVTEGGSKGRWMGTSKVGRGERGRHRDGGRVRWDGGRKSGRWGRGARATVKGTLGWKRARVDWRREMEEEWMVCEGVRRDARNEEGHLS